MVNWASVATPVLLPRKSHGWRSLVGCSPWGRYMSDATERLHFHFSLSCNGEGNGNPFQCSCLKNPRDGRAGWAAVYGVTQSRTQLKWLSSSISSIQYIHLNSASLNLQEGLDKSFGVERWNFQATITCWIVWSHIVNILLAFFFVIMWGVYICYGKVSKYRQTKGKKITIKGKITPKKTFYFSSWVNIV